MILGISLTPEDECFIREKRIEVVGLELIDLLYLYYLFFYGSHPFLISLFKRGEMPCIVSLYSFVVSS